MTTTPSRGTSDREPTGRYTSATQRLESDGPTADTSAPSRDERRVATSQTTGNVTVRTVPSTPSWTDGTSTT